jgi:putative ABC transport system permease protein
MPEFNFLTVSLKNLRRKKFRTGVLIFAIALFVSLLIFTVSFTISVSATLKRTSERLGADLVIVPVGSRGPAEEFLLESKNRSFYMPKSLLEKIRELPEIIALTPQTYLETISGVCCDVARTQIVAFDENSDFIVKPWLKKPLDHPLRKGEAIAGHETSENLGLELLEVEKTIYNKKFRIVGVLQKTGTGLDNALFMNEENLSDIIESGNSPLKKGEISIIFTKVKKGLDPYRVGQIVEGEIVQVDVVARNEMGGELLQTLRDINKIFLVSITLSSILTVFLVWAIFSAIANERSREIGIMRAIGANEAHIVKLFVLEVLVLGLVGSGIGLVVGTYLSISFAKGFVLLKNISASLTFTQHALIDFIGLAVGVFICVTGALIPINRIKKLEPLLAIKEE